MDRSSDAFIELLKPCYAQAVQFCKALTRNKTEAKDLLQDSLLQGLQKLYTLRDDKKFKPWLFSIISRKFLAARKKQLQAHMYAKDLKTEDLTFPDLFVNQSHDPKEELLIRALDSITDKERMALVLFEVGGFSVEEIRYMQKENTLSAVKSRLSRAREKLKSIIQSLEKQTST